MWEGVGITGEYKEEVEAPEVPKEVEDPVVREEPTVFSSGSPKEPKAPEIVPEEPKGLKTPYVRKLPGVSPRNQEDPEDSEAPESPEEPEG